MTNQSHPDHWMQRTVDRYEGPLIRYAERLTGNLEQARDVVQDTFLRLCAENQDRLEGHLAEWLFTVCRNRALDVQRKECRMTSLTDQAMNSWTSAEPSPARLAEQRETTSHVRRILATLPFNQQEVVRLKFQNGLSYREISRITHLTVTNVGFLIHTAIKTVRQRLQMVELPPKTC